MNRLFVSAFLVFAIAASVVRGASSGFYLDVTSDSQACVSAVDTSLYITYVLGTTDTYVVENIFGQNVFSHTFPIAADSSFSFYPFLGSYSMPIGKTAPTSVYISADRIDLFIDVSGFRSTDPTNTYFFESDICFVTYALGISARSADKKSVESSSSQKAVKSAADPNFVNPPSLGLCQFSTATWATYAEAQACLQSVPFNTTTRDQITTSLISILNSYVYREQLKNTGGKNPVKVDVITRLQNISTTSYSNDYSLQVDLTNLFASTQDISTQYTPLLCYQGFEFVQPFLLGSRALANGTQRITVSGVNTGFPQIYYGADFATFIDYEIISIDGEQALNHVTASSNGIPLRDAGARFQAALRTFHTNGFIIPVNSSVTYQLSHPVTGEQITLSVPWYSKVPQISTTTQLQAICFNNYYENCVLKKKDVAQQNTGYSKVSTLLNDNSAKKLGASSSSSKRQSFYPNAVLLEVIGEIALYRVSDRVGVFQITTFNPTVGTVDSAVTTSVAYLAAINRYNFQQVIIDVSSNGGASGSSFYNAFHIAALFQNRTTDTDTFFYVDEIQNNLFSELIQLYWFNLDSFGIEYLFNNTDQVFYKAALANGSLPNPGNWWYNHTVTHSRGGVNAQYSQRIQADQIFDGAATNQILNFTYSRPEFQSYDHWNLQILTDGFCFASCGLFLRGLRQQTNKPIRTVGYGGLISKTLRSSDALVVPLDYSGLSFLSNEMSHLLGSYSQLSSVTPPPFYVVNDCASTNGTNFIYAFYEAYRSTTETTPEDYLDDPVDQRLNIWLAHGESNAGVYFQAATVFETGKTTHNKYFASSAQSVYSYGLLSLLAVLLFIAF